jgi:hypothetical protein
MGLDSGEDRLTNTPRAQAAPQEEAQWQCAASIVERFLKISENPS